MSSNFNTDTPLNKSNQYQTNVYASSVNNSNYNQLLTIRTKKLVELYCVSRLNELLNIKDENKFNNELNLFLSKNDINKGKKFQVNSLPNQNQLAFSNQEKISSLSNSDAIANSSLKHVGKKSMSTSNIPALKYNNNNNSKNNLVSIDKNGRSKSAVTSNASSVSNYRSKSISPHKQSTNIPLNTVNIGEIRKIPNNPNLKNNNVPSTIVTTNVNINNNIKGSSNSNIELQPNKKRKVNAVIQNIDNREQLVPKKSRVNFEDVNYTYKNIRSKASSDTVNISSVVTKETPLRKTTIYIDPNMKLPRTTPVSFTEDIKNPLIKRLIEEKEQMTEKTDGYLPDNINAKDRVYLLMKDNIPSKVPQAIPLSELRYMVQNLPLVNLIPKTHKALTTEIINSALNESRINVVSSRIEELKRLGQWSLRQPKRFDDPWNNTHTHHQILLDEAKWMQADFYEGKKYKVAVCTTIAQAIMDYWNYGKVCCIKIKPPRYLSNNHTASSNYDNNNDESNEVKTLDEKIQNDNRNKPQLDTTSNWDNQKENKNKDLETVSNICAHKFTDKVYKEPHIDGSNIGETKVIKIDNELVTSNEFVDRKERSSLDQEHVVPDIKELDKSVGKSDLASAENNEQESSNSTNGIETERGNVDIITTSSSADTGSSLEIKSIDVSKLLEKPDISQEINVPELPQYSIEEYEKILSERDVKPFKLYLPLSEFSFAEKNILDEVPIYMGVKKNDELKKHNDIPFAPVSKSLVPLQDDGFYKLVERQLFEEQSLVQFSKRRGMFYGNRRSHYLRPPPVPSLKYLQNRTPTIWLPEDDQELVKNINTYAYNWELISANMVHRSSKSYLSNIERRTPWQCFERFVQLNENFNFNDLKGPRAYGAQQWLIAAHRFQQRQNRRISPLGVGNESVQRGHRRLRWASMFEVIRRCIKKRENAPRPNPTQPRKPMDCRNMKVPTPAEMSQLKAQRDEALRRDIQLRRNARNRLLQRQSRVPQNNNQYPTQGQRYGPNSYQVQSSNNQSQISIQLSRGSSRNHSRSTNNNNSTINNNSFGNMEANSNSNNIPMSQHVDKNGDVRYTEEEIVGLYARKIRLQKPNIPPEIALQTAKTYYKKLKYEQQQRFQQQQQSIPPLTERGNQSTSTIDSSGKFLNVPNHTKNEITNNTSVGNVSDINSSSGINNKNISLNINNTTRGSIKSPTPQEILQRFQK